MTPGRCRSEGTVTRGTTAPNRLRRVDRWIAASQASLLRSAERPPLVVDLGFGASPVTTVELYERLRGVRPDVEVVGLEIDPARVEEGARFLAGCGRPAQYRGLTFGLGGFELPVSRPPLLVRAFNVLRQYDEEEAWRAWDRLCEGLAPDGVLVEGTCDEIGRRAVWVTLGRSEAAGSRLRREDGVGAPLRVCRTPHHHVRRARVHLALSLGVGRAAAQDADPPQSPRRTHPSIPRRFRPLLGGRGSAVGVRAAAALDRRDRAPFADLAGDHAPARRGPRPLAARRGYPALVGHRAALTRAGPAIAPALSVEARYCGKQFRRTLPARH